jgi:phospholipid/cholesterol/gamma-HCH transport system substrate-binding protein
MAVKATRILRVIVIFIVAVASSFLLYMLINNFQFTRGRTVRVHFTNVGDLNTGAWVRKAGLKVGSVTRLVPAEDEKTIIATLTFRPGQIVRSTDQFALISKGILGDMYIEQRPGPKDSPLVEEGRLFEGEPSFNVMDLLSGETMTTITDLAMSLKSVADIIKKNQDSIDSALKDIARTAHNVGIVSDRAVEITDSVPDIKRQITSSMDTLTSTVTTVSASAERLIGSVQGNVTMSASDLAASMESLRKITADIQVAVKQLTAQDSVITSLSAPKTSQSLDTSMQNLQEITRQLLVATQELQKILTGISAIFAAQ